ncbi:MAG: DUF2156 domain-containing protein [Deltaproteobacteria bacterium]|nr:DUF2156 domain-containing protein [Deltaproteobacteria bacterium]
MPLKFEPIRINQQEAYARVLAMCPQPTSDYSFINLWAWADEYGLIWAWENDMVWIQQTFPEPVYWAPIGDWHQADWSDILSECISGPAVFTRVPEKLAELWKQRAGEGRVITEPLRGHWDYLYAGTDLISLKGNRFHKKKNLLNQFLSGYPFRYEPLGPEMTEKALALQTDWCMWRDCEASDMLSAENRVIEKVLKNWSSLRGLSGGALLVNDDLVAYTIAEMLGANTLIIHFEKGNPDYKGVYQAINQMFLERFGNSDILVNREQDLDDEGLRKAKMSYHPVDFLRKFRCVV